MNPPVSRYFGGPNNANDPLRINLPDPTACGLMNMACASFAIDECVEEWFQLTTHLTLLNFWLRCRRNDDLPAASEIDPFAFRDAIGETFILEPNDDCSDFRYRLYGTKLAAAIHTDLTGKLISDLPDRASEFFLPYYRTVCLLRRASFSENDAVPEFSSVTRLCRLVLPMAGENGAIERILIGMVPKAREIQLDDDSTS